MLSLTKDIVFEIEWGGVPVIGGSRWSVMSCGATSDEDVMTAYTYHCLRRNAIPNQISPLGNPLSIVSSFPSLVSLTTSASPVYMRGIAGGTLCRIRRCNIYKAVDAAIDLDP